MKRGKDIFVGFGGSTFIHHNKPGSQLTPHTHNEHQLFIPLQGEIKLSVKDKDFFCSPGRMIYLPPKVVHSFSSAQQSGERLIAMIDPAVWKSNRGKVFSARIVPTQQLIKELIFYLLIHPTNKQSPLLIQALITILGEDLAGVEYKSDSADMDRKIDAAADPRILKASTLIREHLENPLPMNELARAAGLSTRNLNRLMLKELGMTPKQLQQQVRLRHAQELLATGNFTVTDVALQSGYSSLSRFIQAFRAFCGRLPSDAIPTNRKPPSC